MELGFLFRVVSFLELCSITIGNTNYLIAVERGTQTRNTPGGLLLVETRWYVWSLHSASESFKEHSQHIIYLPVTQALDLTFHYGDLYGLVESNHMQSAYSLRWDGVDDEELRIAQEADVIRPFRLSLEQIQRVEISPRDDWSSPSLDTREWLFNPSISVYPDGELVTAAFNLANAGVIVMQSSTEDTVWEERLYRENALEPVYQKLPGHSFLAFRQAEEPWSVFYHTPRYSGAYGPTSLPLFLLLLDQGSQVRKEQELSKSEEIGNAFLFDLASDREKRLGLAVIGGIKGQPVLGIYLSEDLGTTWRQKEKLILPKIPVRITMTFGAQEIVIGLVFREEAYYEIAAVYCKL